PGTIEQRKGISLWIIVKVSFFFVSRINAAVIGGDNDQPIFLSKVWTLPQGVYHRSNLTIDDMNSLYHIGFRHTSIIIKAFGTPTFLNSFQLCNQYIRNFLCRI